MCESRSLPRGIPAASLKHLERRGRIVGYQASSAGNTRGLIEALSGAAGSYAVSVSSAGNTRGLIEASGGTMRSICAPSVFRGEYPRPH